MTITKGSANPEVDITKLTPKQWYSPREITINVNDTINWVNNDTEPHTVTSGIGAGISSLLTNAKGKPSGQFDSGLFSSGQSFSLRFNTSGIYNYFCTIHPWMEGIIKVIGNISSIPSYAVNEFGQKINKFPIYNFTQDKSIEVGMSWAPLSILTNEKISFIMDFYQFPQNQRLHLWPYNFVIIQNDKEIYRTNGLSQVGAATEQYAFSNEGKIALKVENANNPKEFVQFGTIVYNNPYGNAKSVQNVSNSSSFLLSPLMLVYTVYVIIIGIPIATVIIIVLYKKKKI